MPEAIRIPVKSKIILFLGNKKLFKVLFWVWALLIFGVSSLPNIPQPDLIIHKERIRLDYFFHFCEYFLLAMLFLFWKTDPAFNIKPGRVCLFLFCGLLFAIVDELHQHFIPGRTVNPIDAVSNGLGLILGLFITYFVVLKLFKNGNNTGIKPSHHATFNR